MRCFRHGFPNPGPLDDMEVRLRFLGMRLVVRGPARWVFAVTVIVVLAIVLLHILAR